MPKRSKQLKVTVYTICLEPIDVVCDAIQICEAAIASGQNHNRLFLKLGGLTVAVFESFIAYTVNPNA